MVVQARTMIPPFEASTLEAIAQILGDTDRGLTGREIEHKLRQCSIPDVDPENTKWKRLCNAFIEFQNEHQVGNHVVKFINVALAPASFTRQPERFEYLRRELNAALSFAGMEVGADGKVRRAVKTTNLGDALARANRLKEERPCRSHPVLQRRAHRRQLLPRCLRSDEEHHVTSPRTLGADNRWSGIG